MKIITHFCNNIVWYKKIKCLWWGFDLPRTLSACEASHFIHQIRPTMSDESVCNKTVRHKLICFSSPFFFFFFLFLYLFHLTLFHPCSDTTGVSSTDKTAHARACKYTNCFKRAWQWDTFQQFLWQAEAFDFCTPMVQKLYKKNQLQMNRIFSCVQYCSAPLCNEGLDRKWKMCFEHLKISTLIATVCCWSTHTLKTTL